ncbi:hypothetical protein NON00_16425 [Roseomonas sp. GC11]|uniref:hypothetical protein n=1 Tax=Roseomonas sp. GC11 TaxID=2950546 RepID=UPI002109656B|nr:hypothetical protein [Roseomonas sp. GC11]MCQ4161506.1 hypothetical protein [Roseomonas sp. GC11]
MSGKRMDWTARREAERQRRAAQTEPARIAARPLAPGTGWSALMQTIDREEARQGGGAKRRR